MDQDIPLGTEVRLGPGDIVLDGWGPTSPTERGTAVPTFRPSALARIPTGPHFVHDPYCRLGSATRLVKEFYDNDDDENILDAVQNRNSYNGN